MDKIVTQPTELAHWHALINEAQVQLNHYLDESLESYLVFLLMRYTNQAELVKRVFALDFLEANQLDASALKTLQMQNVGDQCLLVSGLFPEAADRKNVSPEYIMDLGQSAYYQAHHSEMEMNSPDPALFSKLCEAFRECAALLSTTRQDELTNLINEAQQTPPPDGIIFH